MSWLSEWWHSLFPKNQPPANPQNLRVKTLVADAVVVPGATGEIYMSTDEYGAFILLHGGEGKPAMVLRRVNDGHLRIIFVGGGHQARLQINMGPLGQSTMIWTDNTGPVILDTPTVRALMALLPPPTPAPAPPSPAPVPPAP